MRAGLRSALALCVAGALLLLWSLDRVWAAVPYDSGFTLSHFMREATGRQLAPGAQASAYLALTAIAGLVTLRGWWRVAVGVLMAGAGIGAAAALYPLTTGEQVQRRAFRVFAGCDSCGLSGPQPTAHVSGWVWVAGAGALLVVLAGLVVMVLGRQWPGLSSRYERPAPDGEAPAEAKGEAEATDKGVWDALDRGADPTA